MPPDHERYHLRQAGLGDGAVGHDFAVAHDGEVVADIEDFVQIMGDQDHTYAVVGELADQP